MIIRRNIITIFGRYPSCSLDVFLSLLVSLSRRNWQKRGTEGEDENKTKTQGSALGGAGQGLGRNDPWWQVASLTPSVVRVLSVILLKLFHLMNKAVRLWLRRWLFTPPEMYYYYYYYSYTCTLHFTTFQYLFYEWVIKLKGGNHLSSTCTYIHTTHAAISLLWS